MATPKRKPKRMTAKEFAAAYPHRSFCSVCQFIMRDPFVEENWKLLVAMKDPQGKPLYRYSKLHDWLVGECFPGSPGSVQHHLRSPGCKARGLA